MVHLLRAAGCARAATEEKVSLGWRRVRRLFLACDALLNRSAHAGELQRLGVRREHLRRHGGPLRRLPGGVRLERVVGPRERDRKLPPEERPEAPGGLVAGGGAGGGVELRELLGLEGAVGVPEGSALIEKERSGRRLGFARLGLFECVRNVAA